jgi:hypothetical protein
VSDTASSFRIGLGGQSSSREFGPPVLSLARQAMVCNRRGQTHECPSCSSHPSVNSSRFLSVSVARAPMTAPQAVKLPRWGQTYLMRPIQRPLACEGTIVVKDWQRKTFRNMAEPAAKMGGTTTCPSI